MDNELAIKFDNVAKIYRTGEIGTGTLSRDINLWFARMRNKENPYAKIGSVNNSSFTKGQVWALEDIRLEIKKGDIVGIIGKNGAGKSTLLKILSKVTKPTTGKIYINGSVASLLEVGTGFHPEMTGRENVYLNGAILGMTKKEIDKKFDQIIDFSGVEQYIDTPVKRYSSGMYVRLGFAIAAHLEPDILIVDEVLAVGDASFQKKCLGKIKDVNSSKGRTVLFVSHNISAVQSLCNTGVLLENGTITVHDTINEVIKKYKESYDNNEDTSINNFSRFPIASNTLFTPTEFSLVDDEFNHYTFPYRADTDVLIRINFETEEINSFLKIGIFVTNDLDEIVFMSFHNDKKEEDCTPVFIGKNSFIVRVPKHFLNEGNYNVELLAHVDGSPNFWKIGYGPQLKLTVSGGLSESKLWTYRRRGITAPVLDFVNLRNE